MDDTMNSAATVDLAPDGSAWFADRIKAVEDQRAADVAEIERLRIENEMLRRAVEKAARTEAGLRNSVLARDEVINDLRARVWNDE